MSPGDSFEYDFFIAHASADVVPAQRLHDLLAPTSRVFLDVASIQPGDHWRTVISGALKRSRVVVVLLSRRTEQAWYVADEITAAIALVRRPNSGRRVVTVRLEPGLALPYGLQNVQALDGRLEAVAERLGGVVPPSPVPSPMPLARADLGRAVDIALKYRIGRDALLHWIDAGVIGRLPLAGSPFEQLRSDATVLLGFGGGAITEWLRNLEESVGPFPESAEIRALRERSEVVTP